MSEPARYLSPLSARYASAAMQRLLSPLDRAVLWRRLWLALAEAQSELGLDIPEVALEQMRSQLTAVDFAAVERHETRLRHEVMAHIRAFGEAAPAAAGYIHLGATSAYVTDNADLILLREALRLVLARLGAVLGALRAAAERHRALPTLGWTHLQPAQLTTVGKRITLWILAFLTDAEEIERRADSLPFLGCRGATGTQASSLDLFDGDADRARRLDELVAQQFGFSRIVPVSGQTYPRKLDAQVLGALAGVGQSAAKLAADLRLLQHLGEMLEPMEAEQVGSSAMPYKRNPMRAERISALARFLMHLPANAEETAAQQWLERTLDDSANRRLVLPEAFLAADAILVLALDIARGLEVREKVIRRHVARELPFLATERCLMLAVRAGGDRQALHEVIRRHSLEVARRIAEEDAPNDLLELLARDPAFGGVPIGDLATNRDPLSYVGRAPEQVDEFLRDVVDPVLARLPPCPESAVRL